MSTGGLASHHPWHVIITLLLILVAATAYAFTGLHGVVTTEMTLTEDFEAVTGLDKIESSEVLSDTANASETFLVRSLDGTIVDDPAFMEKTNEVVSSVRELQGTCAGKPPAGPPSPHELLTATTELGPQVLNYFKLNQFGVPGIEQFVNQDLTVLLVSVTFAERVADVPIGEYIDVVEQYNADRSHVTTIDTVSIDEELSAIAAQNLIQRQMIGIPVTVVVLIFCLPRPCCPRSPQVLVIFDRYRAGNRDADRPFSGAAVLHRKHGGDAASRDRH